MDPVFVGIYTKRDITFMAKAELCDAPVLGWVMKKLNVVRLQRDGSDISAVRAVLGALKNDSCISLFPQGTRCRYHAPLREEMKDGVSFLAMQSKAPVVPVGIYMKGFCGGLFKKTYISFGKPIVPADSIPRGAKNIGLATDMIYEAICKEVAEAQAMAEKK